MSTGPQCRERLNSVNARLEQAKLQAEELAANAEKTKTKLVEAANGTYVKMQEMLRGTRDEG